MAILFFKKYTYSLLTCTLSMLWWAGPASPAVKNGCGPPKPESLTSEETLFDIFSGTGLNKMWSFLLLKNKKIHKFSFLLLGTGFTRQQMGGVDWGHASPQNGDWSLGKSDREGQRHVCCLTERGVTVGNHWQWRVRSHVCERERHLKMEENSRLKKNKRRCFLIRII